MLDSLVRVSRRVGWVADTDTADANTPRVTGDFKTDRIHRHLQAGANGIGRLSIARWALYAGVYFFG